MTIQYQNNPTFTIDSVDLSAWTTAGSVNVVFETLDKTTYDNTSRLMTSGLGNHTATIDLFMDYTAAATYATLKDLVGTAVTIVYQPASGAQTATNPGFQLVDTYLGELPVISMTLGELQSISLEFVGGVYSPLV